MTIENLKQIAIKYATTKGSRVPLAPDELCNAVVQYFNEFLKLTADINTLQVAVTEEGGNIVFTITGNTLDGKAFTPIVITVDHNDFVTDQEFEEFKTSVTEQLNNKLDKSNWNATVYVVDSQGIQNNVEYTSNPSPNTFVYRDDHSNFVVNSPTENGNPTPKSYVDNALAGKLDAAGNNTLTGENTFTNEITFNTMKSEAGGINFGNFEGIMENGYNYSSLNDYQFVMQKFVGTDDYYETLINADLITYKPAGGNNTYEFHFPNKSGTFAMTTDITVDRSDLVTDQEFEEFKTSVTEQLNNKLDKSNWNATVYVVDSQGIQNNVEYTSNPSPNTFVYRDDHSNFVVNSPTENGNPTPKSYVDNALAGKLDAAGNNTLTGENTFTNEITFNTMKSEAGGINFGNFEGIMENGYNYSSLNDYQFVMQKFVGTDDYYETLINADLITYKPAGGNNTYEFHFPNKSGTFAMTTDIIKNPIYFISFYANEPSEPCHLIGTMMSKNSYRTGQKTNEEFAVMLADNFYTNSNEGLAAYGKLAEKDILCIYSEDGLSIRCLDEENSEVDLPTVMFFVMETEL